MRAWNLRELKRVFRGGVNVSQPKSQLDLDLLSIIPM